MEVLGYHKLSPAERSHFEAFFAAADPLRGPMNPGVERLRPRRLQGEAVRCPRLATSRPASSGRRSCGPVLAALGSLLLDDLAVDRLGTLRGDIGIEIDSLDIFGMRLSQTPLVLVLADGRLTIDPIDARLNGGVLHADPQIVARKDNSTWLVLSSETRLEGAMINDEVSHRVLSYVRPVLDERDSRAGPSVL